jgi:uncharacterized membrane protein YcaP (DUF421 family)
MDDEQVKRYTMFAVIGFNVVVILMMLIFMFMRGGMMYVGLFDFIIAICLGTAAAGGIFVAAQKLGL